MNKQQCVPAFALERGWLAVQYIVFCNFVHTEHFPVVVVGFYIFFLSCWTEIEKVSPRFLPLVHLQDFIKVFHLVTELGTVVQIIRLSNVILQD